MNLEHLIVGRMYRVKQSRKLLNLRLKNIQPIKGIGTELYELKPTVEGYRLWMLDESNGKGYTISNFTCIEAEVIEKPKENSLVRIVTGKLVDSLGSITLYRVKETRRDVKTQQDTVVIYGGFKNYELPLKDVRVYRPEGKDPETLLSKESKKVGDMPTKFLPGPAKAKPKLLGFLGKQQAFGSLTGEKETPEEKAKREAKEKAAELAKEAYAARTKELKEGGLIPSKQQEGIEMEEEETPPTRATGKKQTVIKQTAIIPPQGNVPFKGQKPKQRKQKINEVMRMQGKTRLQATNQVLDEERRVRGESIGDVEEMSEANSSNIVSEVIEKAESEIEVEEGVDHTLVSGDTAPHLQDVTTVPLIGNDVHPEYIERIEKEKHTGIGPTSKSKKIGLKAKK